MKTTNLMKKRQTLFSALLAGSLAITGISSTTVSASARRVELHQSIESKIFEVCQYQCIVSGEPLSTVEEKDLMNTIKETIQDYATENNCSYDEAGEQILSEMMTESGLSSLPQNTTAAYGSRGSSGSGNGGLTYQMVQLPESDIGNIFFADNEWAWNHVGMYTSKDYIIEARPNYDVQEVSIYSTEGKQHRTFESFNQSCIMRVNGVSADMAKGAVEWAQQYVGRPYSYSFLANKSSDESDFNCSELVWKAYKYGKYKNNYEQEVTIGIDLDSNDGVAVYPNNIKDSDKVSQVCVW